MAFECPKCSKIMYPQDDGSCPFCGENIRKEKPRAEENPRGITVRHNQLLPNICCVCGNVTDSYKNIKSTRSTLSNIPIIGILITIIAFFISPLIIFFRFKDNGRYDKVEVRMPICKKCKKTETLKPETINLDEYEMTFLVHENLKREFEKNKKYISIK